MPQKQAAALVLHQQDGDQHQDHRTLRGKNGNILGQAVIPDVGLDEMQQDEENVRSQRNQVDRMQARGVFLDPCLGIKDQAPERDLVQGIEHPGREMRPEGRCGQFPVIPGRALVRQVRDGSEALSRPPDQCCESQAESDTTPQERSWHVRGLSREVDLEISLHIFILIWSDLSTLYRIEYIFVKYIAYIYLTKYYQ